MRQSEYDGPCQRRTSFSLAGVAIRFTLVLCIAPQLAYAGRNASGSARLSWSPDQNIPALQAIVGDTLILYCRLQIAEMNAVGLALEWEPKATPGCYEQVTPPLRVGCGRVLAPDGPPQAFNGRPFLSRISFAPGARHDVVAFAFLVGGCTTPPPTSFRLVHASARDRSHAIDPLHLVGDATSLGGQAPVLVYDPPPWLRMDNQTHNLFRTWSWRIRTPRVIRQQIAEGGEPAAAAQRILESNASLLRVDVAQLRLERVQRSPQSAHVHFRQNVSGYDVQPGGVSVHFNRLGEATKITNEAIPNLPSAVSPPTVTRSQAIAAAQNELGTAMPEDAYAASLIVYAGLLEPRLVWRVAGEEWVVLVDAYTESIVAAREHALQYTDGFGRVWLVNPLVALNDSSLTDMNDSCYTRIEQAYETVTLHDLLVTDGIYHLEGPRAKVVTTAIQPVTTTDGQFLYPRCDPPVTTKAFEQVMAYHYVDRAQAYVQEALGWTGLNGQQKVNPWRGAGNYSTEFDEIWVSEHEGYDSGEDAEFFLHEWEHSLQHASCLSFTAHHPEEYVVAEGTADFVAALLFAHESTLFDGRWAEWGGKAATGTNLRRVDRPKSYPTHIELEPHGDGEIWSRALWDVFQATEASLGFCATGSVQSIVQSCPARNRVMDHMIGLYDEFCEAGFTLHNAAVGVLEREEDLGNPTILNAMVDALDQRGYFYSEHELPFGVEMHPLSVPLDQAVGVPTVLRMIVRNPVAGVTPGSVKLHVGVNGQYSTMTTMTDSSGVFLATITPPAGSDEAFVTYYVEATNALYGVTAHWPKSAPEVAHAKYFVGDDRQATIHTFAVADQIAAQTSKSYRLVVPRSGFTTDVNCRLALECSSIDSVTVVLEDSVSARSVVLLDFADGYMASMPDSMDLWIDDELDAPFNQLKPFNVVATAAQRMDQLDGVDLTTAIWKLRITNGTNAPLDVARLELQVSTGIVPTAVEDVAPAPRVLLARVTSRNPFSAGIAFELMVPERSVASFKLYDAQGRCVRTLIGGEVLEGLYAIDWDGRDARGLRVPSGVYFYRLEAGPEVRVGKVVRIR